MTVGIQIGPSDFKIFDKHLLFVILPKNKMSVLNCPYQPPIIFRNGHVSTIYSAIFRRVKGVVYHRERLELPDGDFLDLDWSFSESKSDRVMVLLHGLEGGSTRPYMLGMAKAFNRRGWDVIAVNFRGCTAVPNRLYKSYHGGATDDLELILQQIQKNKNYCRMGLVGFSLGANLLLKYLGEGRKYPRGLIGGVAISVPCSLSTSLEQLNLPSNFAYRIKFLAQLKKKFKQKFQMFPERFPGGFPQIKTLIDFDNCYTSKAHGFLDAKDYYQKNSCIAYLTNIQHPVLILNAKNDSFLAGDCYPTSQADENPYIQLEISKYGGHVGYVAAKNLFYSERRAADFFETLI